MDCINQIKVANFCPTVTSADDIIRKGSSSRFNCCPVFISLWKIYIKHCVLGVLIYENSLNFKGQQV